MRGQLLRAILACCFATGLALHPVLVRELGRLDRASARRVAYVQAAQPGEAAIYLPIAMTSGGRGSPGERPASTATPRPPTATATATATRTPTPRPTNTVAPRPSPTRAGYPRP